MEAALADASSFDNLMKGVGLCMPAALTTAELILVLDLGFNTSYAVAVNQKAVALRYLARIERRFSI